MVLNDNWTSGATNRLVRSIGRDTNRRSFIAICQGSCRGGAGNQHMKFYLFSKAGKAKDVVMVGSANTTGYGARTQWNDMYTATGQPELRDLYTKIFEQLVRDRKLADPTRAPHRRDLRERVLPALRHHRGQRPGDGAARRGALRGDRRHRQQRTHRDPHRDVRLGRRPRPLPRQEGRRARQERLRHPRARQLPRPQGRRHPQARWRPRQERRPRPRRRQGHRLRRHAATRSSPTRSTWPSAAAGAARWATTSGPARRTGPAWG